MGDASSLVLQVTINTLVNLPSNVGVCKVVVSSFPSSGFYNPLRDSRQVRCRGPGGGVFVLNTVCSESVEPCPRCAGGFIIRPDLQHGINGRHHLDSKDLKRRSW